MHRLSILLPLVVSISVVMAACSSSDQTPSDTQAAATNSEAVELPAGALEALDNYTNALLTGDGEAMLAFVTEDFAFLSYGTDVQEREYRARYVTSNYADFDVEVIGGSMVLGSDDTYIVSIPESATASSGVVEGFSTIRIVRVDGVWLIDVHRFTGE